MTHIDTSQMVGNAHRQRHSFPKANAPIRWEMEDRIDRAKTDAERLALAVFFYNDPASASEQVRRYSILFKLAQKVLDKMNAAAAEAERAKRRAAERRSAEGKAR